MWDGHADPCTEANVLNPGSKNRECDACKDARFLQASGKPDNKTDHKVVFDARLIVYIMLDEGEFSNFKKASLFVKA